MRWWSVQATCGAGTIETWLHQRSQPQLWVVTQILNANYVIKASGEPTAALSLPSHNEADIRAMIGNPQKVEHVMKGQFAFSIFFSGQSMSLLEWTVDGKSLQTAVRPARRSERMM